MNFDFDHLPDRLSTESIKWNLFGKDVLPMWVADMDFISPPPVIEALTRRVQHGVFGYPGQMPALTDAVVERMDQLYGWKIDRKDVVYIPGVVTAFNTASHAVARPEAGLLIQTPVYPPFFGASSNAGMLHQQMELTRGADGTYTIDFDAFEAAITPETCMFLLCNPHNPVGRVFTRAELEKMAEICLRHGVQICSDEIHCELLFCGQAHIPMASLSEEIARQTITLISPSKTFNIAGLECSFAIIQDPDLRKRFEAGREGMAGHVNVLGQTAALAAYRDGQSWLDELLKYLEKNRDILFEFVNQELPGINMGCPEGTYLAWLDCREAGLDESPAQFFLKHAKVALNEGSTFGKGGEGFARLNFGCPRSMLLEALERMKAALLARP